jgi:integrase
MVERKRIGLQAIKALRPGQTLWDGSVIGFAARRQHGSAVVYCLKFRTAEGRQRWFTIGRHGAPWTPDTARTEATRLLGRVAQGEDPAAGKLAKRRAETVSELCDMYMADAIAGRVMTRFRQPKKATTLAIDNGRVERHIKPLIGSLGVAAVTSTDVESLLHDIAAGKTAARVKTKSRGLAHVRGGRGTANRVVRLLGGIFSYAIKHKMRTGNPVHGVGQYADGERKRPLSEEEYKALGTALYKAEQESIWPHAISAIRFLALTGWRRGEALCLKSKPDIDIGRRTAFLPDTKSGKSERPLSSAACEMLRTAVKKDGLIFPSARGSGDVVMSGFRKQFKEIAKLGGLADDITPHTLRHSFASVANDLGYSDLTIAALIGHKGRTMTSKYVHGADAVLLAAADAVAARIQTLMGARGAL